MEENDWDNYWVRHDRKKSFSENIFTLMRKVVIAPGTAYFFDKIFPKKGSFLEAGCGSGESSIKIRSHERKFIALDYSVLALERAKKQNFYHKFKKGDVRKLPFKDNSFDGIWSVGVLEHFPANEVPLLLNESFRVLKKGGKILMLVPPKHSSSIVFFNILNKFIKFQVPDEPSQPKSKEEIKKWFEKAGFKKVYVSFPFRLLCIYYVIAGEK
ncbi:MAG: class I SAM-dependent methyltransferase [Candidatus Diapherotrites archaeon]